MSDMKLIMERFEKAMSEQLAGVTMPLNIGAATGAAKSAKAKEDKKNLTLKHNRNLIEKLRSLGRDPVLIELVEGDIKGISHPDLLKALKKFMAKRAATEFTTVKRRAEERAQTFAVARNGSIRPVKKGVPVKMSPSFLADILVKILKPIGLLPAEMNTTNN